jgi:riboflavin synthase
MFTGIVEYVSEIKILNDKVYLKNKFENVIIGESIALNGICLTVEKIINDDLVFSVGYETLSKTNIKNSKFVNVERALKVGDRIGGSFVSGHIDGLLSFLGKNKINDSYAMKFSMPKEKWAIVEKGSITLNGINLTIAEKSLDTFTVQVIPHTFEITNLKELKYGEKLNYEIDIFARYAGRN